MKVTGLLITLLTLLLTISMTVPVHADISNAAVLYLRIAPGARAAGMGEAYVAIADDATSTHWNPAGLGAYPLTPSWIESSIPSHLRPITGAVAMKTRRGGDYMAYDLWAITPAGLARYDNKKWFMYEEFSTKTDQTVRQIVASYFNLTDNGVIDQIAKRVAGANNDRTYAYLDSLKARILPAVPEGYASAKTFDAVLDSLMVGYDRCLINWERVKEAEKLYNDGVKDGTLSETEMDRIFIAIEKARTRFIPEVLKIHYSTLFKGELKSIVSSGDYLVVGTDSGLFGYDGDGWQALTYAKQLPSQNITSLFSSEATIFIGTDKGVATYDGDAMTVLGAPGELPEGPVSALTWDGVDYVWAVVNDQLYRYDGESWSDSRIYTVVLDDTPERIAEKFAVYGTAAEKEKFIVRLKELNKRRVVELPAVGDSSVTTADSDTAGVEPEAEEAAEPELELLPGYRINIPLVTAVKGEVTSIRAGYNDRLWLGTSYGLLYWDGRQWNLPGYRDYEVEADQSVSDILAVGAGDRPLATEHWKTVVMAVNNLESENVTSGQTIKIYRNPTAAPVRSINSTGSKTYFATSAGLIEFDGTAWSKVDHHGLDRAGMVAVDVHGNGLWLASEKKVITKANGMTDFSLMYVNWLPELADDLYYAFGSAASHIEGVGTIGGNVTYISYGTITRTGETGEDLGTFESFDAAFTGSWGTALTNRLKFGLSAKLLLSKLADQGAGIEKGQGSSTGFAVDVGLLYLWSQRLSLGMAMTNFGPDMAYIDAAQSDPLPRNLALGVAYKVLQTDYYHFLLTTEVNKSLVGVDDKFRDELEQLVINSGGEFMYNDILAIRAGYIYDQEGDVKTATVGLGLGPLGIFKFDFSYIPSNSDVVLANTMRWSFSIRP